MSSCSLCFSFVFFKFGKKLKPKWRACTFPGCKESTPRMLQRGHHRIPQSIVGVTLHVASWKETCQGISNKTNDGTPEKGLCRRVFLLQMVAWQIACTVRFQPAHHTSLHSSLHSPHFTCTICTTIWPFQHHCSSSTKKLGAINAPSVFFDHSAWVFFTGWRNSQHKHWFKVTFVQK